MKRLAVLTLTAVLAASGMSAAVAAGPLPPPTGAAPTAPQVPVPSVRNGVVMPASGVAANRFGAGVVRVSGLEEGSVVGAPTVVADDGVVGSATCCTKPRWCTDCAPAVRHPLPPLPGNVGFVGCDSGACGVGGRGHDGTCWQRFKAWFCFQETPVHLPCTPTPRIPPLYTYFPPCAEKSCATGCGAGGCGTGGHGFRLPGRGVGGACEPCPPPAQPIMPGYRFASPEVPAGGAAVPAGPVVTTSYRAPVRTQMPAANQTPAPVVPYKPAVRPFAQ